VAVDIQDFALDSGEHVVQFYEHDADLVGAVGPYLLAAAAAGDVAIVIATEAHRRAFEAELEAKGIDVAQASARGRFICLDAASTMATFMSGGQIDHDAFHEVIGGLVRTAAESGRPIRAYGEMVALLWDSGDVLAAIELETLWNDLARELPFSLFCSYPAASVASSEHAEALHQVCHLHSSVLNPFGKSGQGAADCSSETELVAEFPAAREAPGRARRMAVASLRQWGHDGPLVEDVALVLSELATNAVVHAGSPFSVTVRVKDSTLRVAVADASPQTVAMREQGLSVQRGHGLGLVDVLATRWGVEDTSDGKVVWVELTCRSARPAAGAAGESA
jgi:anti-sigma regulatory factor (Ser/Thr protein kinase)